MEHSFEMVITNNTWFPSKMSVTWDLTTIQDFHSLKNNSSTNIPGPVFFPCNNPDNLMDQATAKRVRAVLYMTVLASTELLGIIVNLINCLVFVKQGLKDRINLCLFSLALADISFLILLFSVKFFSFLGLFDKELEAYWERKHLEVVLGPMLGSLTTSNLMTMIISVERCICVVSPFTAKKFLKTRYMAAIIVIVFIFILGLNSMQNLRFIAVPLTDPVTNRTQWVTRFGDFYLDNSIILDILFNRLLALTIPPMSLIVVIITTSITIIKLRQTLAWRQQSGDSQVSAVEAREAAVTRMLTVICLIYVCTITPSVTQAYIRTLVLDYGPQGKYCNTFKVVQTLIHILEVTNSSVNFFVYFTMGTRFRDTVRQVFGTWRERKESTAEQKPTNPENHN